MRISDWSSDVCSSDLIAAHIDPAAAGISHKPLLPTASTTNHLKEGWEPPFRGGVKQKRRRSDDGPAPLSAVRKVEIGRASCRERVCQYVSISVVAEALRKKVENTNSTQTSKYN